LEGHQATSLTSPREEPPMGPRGELLGGPKVAPLITPGDEPFVAFVTEPLFHLVIVD